MTTTFEHPGLAACPACTGAVDTARIAASVPQEADLWLSVPDIHCAACISGVEAALSARPDVREARVNLTLKRVAVRTLGPVEADALIDTLGQSGYRARELDGALLEAGRADAVGRALLTRLGVAGFAMMNVMLLSVAVWSGADAITRDMMHWISAAIALPAVAFCGQPFFLSAGRALMGRRLNMDVPITLAILLAAGTSLFETMHSGEHAYFDAAISLTFFLLAGRYLDHRARASARSAAQELAALEIPRALRVVDGVETLVGVQELAVGDLVALKPGTGVPVDGIVREGSSDLDRAFMTGESAPMPVSVGTSVHAGEINLTGPLLVEVTAAGQDTTLRRIADLVAQAESGRNRFTSLADQAAALYAPGVHILSLLAGVGWYLYTYDLRISVNIAAAVLIITCPCALGLAVPAVTTAASGRLYRKGLLVKDGTALERLAEVDTIVFDKTGTLTSGMPRPSGLDALSPHEQSLLNALCAGSNHPHARAVHAALTDAQVGALRLTDRKELPGSGIEASFDGEKLRFGRATWLGLADAEGGRSYLQLGSQAPKPILFQDTLRDGAIDCLGDLKAAGYRTILLSGDTSVAVGRFAQTLELDQAVGDLKPDDKAAFVRELQSKGAKVLMVGDGLNDTAALRTAHVSISPATALEAARVASDMVILGEDLRAISQARALAAVAVRRVRQNFFLATVYNVVAVPLAIVGLATPLIAALSMSASSLTVSLNALRLPRN